MHRGIATFTLDYGHCPPWLFERMVKLAREMMYVLVDEYGPDELIKRIADPVWFQSFGTVLAFDWNASGLTTVLTGALKEAIRGQEMELGIFICGGKGKTSRKTPDQIQYWGDILRLGNETTSQLVTNSKMSAKVDSSLVQDGYQLYHHSFFFSKNGAWSVVQQGMNTINKTARRYHWYDKLTAQTKKDFVNEPHTGIASQKFGASVLNMVSRNSTKTRVLSTKLVNGGYQQLHKDIEILRKHENSMSKMLALRAGEDKYTLLKLNREDFSHHAVERETFANSKYLEKIFQRITDKKPATYQELVALEGVGPKTIRALALIAEVLYGAAPSYEDPARYSFAHGGKDAIPYPVDRDTYDTTIEVLKKAVQKTKLAGSEKNKILHRLT